jgi:hypothetical protein
MKVCFVLLKSIPLGKEEVTLVAQQPLLRDDVSMLMVSVPIKISGLIKRFQTNCASDSHAAKGDLAVGGGTVGPEDCHAREVQLAGAASKPAVNNVLQVHLQEEIDLIK